MNAVIVDVAKSLCLMMDFVGVFLIVMARWRWHTTVGWGKTGIVLLVIALGNAVTMLSVGENPTSQVSSLFAVVVFGALGSRFLGNWLTEGAEPMVSKKKVDSQS